MIVEDDGDAEERTNLQSVRTAHSNFEIEQSESACIDLQPTRRGQHPQYLVFTIGVLFGFLALSVALRLWNPFQSSTAAASVSSSSPFSQLKSRENDISSRPTTVYNWVETHGDFKYRYFDVVDAPENWYTSQVNDRPLMYTSYFKSRYSPADFEEAMRATGLSDAEYAACNSSIYQEPDRKVCAKIRILSYVEAILGGYDEKTVISCDTEVLQWTALNMGIEVVKEVLNTTPSPPTSTFRPYGQRFSTQTPTQRDSEVPFNMFLSSLSGGLTAAPGVSSTYSPTTTPNNERVHKNVQESPTFLYRWRGFTKHSRAQTYYASWSSWNSFHGTGAEYRPWLTSVGWLGGLRTRWQISQSPTTQLGGLATEPYDERGLDCLLKAALGALSRQGWELLEPMWALQSERWKIVKQNSDYII
mmetsp:Transcript_37280/g.81178  ORF Transcript_37280/g.81178 Transcript_37280/m.81178 type:complete len:417 (-) Transcript_37280:13-1263(-)